MKSIAVIGGGVAGLSASIYALRSGADVTLFEQFGLGGLVATIDKIENFPSYKSVEGWKLANDMASQAKALGLKVIRQRVLSLKKSDMGFEIVTDKGEYTFPSAVIATGTAHNKLGIEGDYVGRGVSYCATCDGAFFRNRPVAVAGGGRSAVSEATYLANLCEKVYLLVPSAELDAEQKAVEELVSHANVQILYNATVASVCGEDQVRSVKVYSDGQLSEIETDALFVATGAQPVTDFVQINDLKRERGYIVVDGRGETSVKGLFAAGDVTSGSLKQIVTACADGAKAGSFASAFSAKAK